MKQAGRLRASLVTEALLANSTLLLFLATVHTIHVQSEKRDYLRTALQVILTRQSYEGLPDTLHPPLAYWISLWNFIQGLQWTITTRYLFPREKVPRFGTPPVFDLNVDLHASFWLKCTL